MNPQTLTPFGSCDVLHLPARNQSMGLGPRDWIFFSKTSSYSLRDRLGPASAGQRWVSTDKIRAFFDLPRPPEATRSYGPSPDASVSALDESRDNLVVTLSSPVQL